MKTLKAFERFAKGRPVESSQGSNCVIYTRVSTREQAEHNMSLSTQRKACESYAKKNHFTIMAYFGGTYESAKTDERIEFNNMLFFVKKSREKISYIIVYSVDRFSRSGANAIYIADQLRHFGINILSVSQPTDVSTPSGSLQQNIQFIFSEYDNQLRREKTIVGMRDKLLQGEWCTKPPKGYDIITVNGKRSIKVNQIGGLIRKAFLWKYYERIQQTEIRQRLYTMGLKITKGYMSAILRNPFYCGILSNKLLAGKVIAGKHEKLISRELFLAVNGLLSHSRHINATYSLEKEELPLKGLLFCHKCGARLTGYVMLKKDIPYYKCTTIGCSCNKNASQLGFQFAELLKGIKIDEKRHPSLKKEFTLNFVMVEKMAHKSLSFLKGNLTRIENQIEVIKERLALGQISESLFEKQLAKFAKERVITENEMEKAQAGLVPKQDIYEEAGKLLNNLAGFWLSSNLGTKRLMQTLIFPEGLWYDKLTDRLIPKMLSVGFYISES